MYTYKTIGTCSRQILFDVTEDNIIKEIRFIGGCMGNLQGISKLATGKHIDDVIASLQGIKCRNNTSCPDQLAKALIDYKTKK